jgi:hypothetical protein
LKKSNTKVLYSNTQATYLISVSDIFSQDRSKVFSKDALVISVFKNGSSSTEAAQTIISDGKRLIFFDNVARVGITCDEDLSE